MRNLAPLQIISLFGILFSVAAHIVLIYIDKKVDNYWYIYPTWVIIFIVGLLFKKFSKEEGHHHHH